MYLYHGRANAIRPYESDNPVNPDSKPVACKYENEYLSKKGKR
jgi:hypothetical protein